MTQKEEQKDKSMENRREDEKVRGSAQAFQKERTQVTKGKKSSVTGGRELI